MDVIIAAAVHLDVPQADTPKVPMDAGGHYSRPSMFSLRRDRSPRTTVHESIEPGEVERVCV